MSDKIYNAAMYVRLSKEDGDKAESDSIVNQKNLIYEFLKSVPDINLVEEISDDGYTGVNFERPGFINMMDAIKSGRVDCVVVKDLSRFGRDFAQSGRYIEMIFPFLGVRFISINDGIDSLKNKGDNILVPIKNLLNDAYSRDISMKTRSQLEIKRKNGDFIGSFVAFGYMKDESNHNKLKIDEFAASVVQDIFAWRIEGQSCQSIANKLNARSIPSPLEYKKSLGLNFSTSFKTSTQASWSAVAVGRILKNDIYIGTLTQGKRGTPNHKIKTFFQKPTDEWVRISENHEPIISKCDFQLVSQLMSSDTRIAPNETSVYMFSGMLYCGDCSQNMIRKPMPYKGRQYIYYLCGGSRVKSCSSHRISHVAVEKAVTVSLQKHIDNIVNMESIMEFVDDIPLNKAEIQKLDVQIEIRREEIERYNNLKVKLFESLTDGLIDKNEYKRLKSIYTAKSQTAEQAILDLTTETEKILSDKSDRNLWIEMFKEYRNFSSLTRKMVVSLVEKILVYEGKRLEIRFRYQNEYVKLYNSICNNANELVTGVM